MKEEVVLETIGISKHFGVLAANDQVDFNLRKGEIHVLMGENGAGKSTLMHVISGLYPPDAGQIIVGGHPARMDNPGDALRSGICMVHQHFMLIPAFTVTENIVLGNEITRGCMLDMESACKIVQDLSESSGLDVDPYAVTETLPVGIQQRVEILKALYRQARILILDEPTAVLTPRETEDLFGVLRRLTDSGVSIVFITHKLKEVMDIADRITVMRQGRAIATIGPDETDERQLAEMMVGRSVSLEVEKQPMATGPVMLKVDRIRIRNSGKNNVDSVRDLSFEIRSGEILGIAGVQGNGQTELAGALAGLQPMVSGEILLRGKRLSPGDPRERVSAGMGHIPEDRVRDGLVLPFSIADNQVLSTYHRYPFAVSMIRRKRAIYKNAARLIDRFDIRAPAPETAAGSLSGGNQQKVIVSRELSRDICFLLANQPTRGLDVGSIEYIHGQIVAMRDRGVAVLLISAELDEIMALSDRIGVMYRGELVRVFDAAETTREQLGLLMAGSDTLC
jgi:ABC-type uncharacterized transport system ATPase subunit